MIIKNCKMCAYYRCEEIGDSDFGAIYAAELTCSEYKDCGEDEELIPDFDRETERDCCKLEFWLVLEVDEELKAIFDSGVVEPNIDSAYKRFEEKYLN